MRGALELVLGDESNLARLYRQLAELDELCGCVARERFYEIGSPGGLRETDDFLRSLPVDGAA